MLKLKLQYFGHPMGRNYSLEKTLMLGKIKGGRKRGQQDEMIGCHHWRNGHELALAVGDGQGSLVCCSPWGRKELDTTEWLSWLESGAPGLKSNSATHSVGGFPNSSVGKEAACCAGDTEDTGSIPGLGRSPGGGNGNPLQYSRLKSLMDRGAWWATDHRVAKNWTWLSD